MLEVMLDVNGWQSLFDFASGEPRPEEGKSYLDLAKRVSARHPYPGDLNVDTIKWVTDFALDICAEYDPQLMVVSYANCNILRINSELNDIELGNVMKHTVSEALRFSKEANYEPIIVSTGNMRKIDKLIDCPGFDGYLTVASDSYMAGIIGATDKDLETVKRIEGISYETGAEFIAKYKITDQYAIDRTPDLILYADEDISFTNTGNRGTTLKRTMRKERTCSVYTELPGIPDSIYDFREFLDKELQGGQRIAVIIVEGVDNEYMPQGYKKVLKEKNGIYPEHAVFYYALLNGKEFNEVGMPYIFHNPFARKDTENRYPFSYIKSDKYQAPIGLNRDFKTAAVGTRSGILHSACMCDYSFECHCRGLAESGILTFINGDKLG